MVIAEGEFTDRELEALIAEKFLGWQVRLMPNGSWYGYKTEESVRNATPSVVPYFYTCPEDCWFLVKKVQARPDYCCMGLDHRNDTGAWRLGITVAEPGQGVRRIECLGDTKERAICRLVIDLIPEEPEPWRPTVVHAVVLR
jgi:hypothetical protein